jgi:lipopolysaccharide/colanic/teichoic acid biosynthesis glycosyltransferase
MSLVGPRPEVAEFVAAFPAEYAEILTVKPGITHQGTLVFRNEEEILAGAADPMKLYLERVMPRKLQIYRDHLRQGIWTELGIILATVFPRGRRGATFTTGKLQTAGVAVLDPRGESRAAGNKRAMKESA